MGPSWWDQHPYKKRKRYLCLSVGSLCLSFSLKAHTKERQCEHTDRWQLFISPGGRASPDTEPAGYSAQTTQTPELQEINICCLYHPVYGTLSEQPKPTKIIFFLKVHGAGVEQNGDVTTSVSLKEMALGRRTDLGWRTEGLPERIQGYGLRDCL